MGGFTFGLTSTKSTPAAVGANSRGEREREGGREGESEGGRERQKERG
jgi:hypothetical protein